MDLVLERWFCAFVWLVVDIEVVVAECNARWLLHLINNFLNFLTETILNPYLMEFSYPKNPRMCDPIQVTLLKMQPHSSQSSRENATPSSGTSPLASYKEVPPPPSGRKLHLE